MTTVAHVKRLVQPLLRRHSDLGLVGRSIIVKPVHHVLRGVFVDRSLDPLTFVPTRYVLTLFEPRDNIYFDFNERISRKMSWQLGTPGLEDDICRAIEEQALPILRSIRSFDDFVRFASEQYAPYKYYEHTPALKIYVDAARGDLTGAIAESW